MSLLCFFIQSLAQLSLLKLDTEVLFLQMQSQKTARERRSSVVSPAERNAAAELPSRAVEGLLCWQATSLQQLSGVYCVIFFWP